jgi:replicative DNA helicase
LVLRGDPTIEFEVASPQLAEDLHHAFIRFGILSRLSQKTQQSWRVVVNEPGSIKRYQEEIGWLGEKNKRFAGYTYVITRRGGNKGHAPKEVWGLVRAAAERQGLSLSELARRCGETTKRGKYAGYNPYIGKSIPRYRLAAYARVLENKDLRLISSTDIYWDEVVSIEPIGEHRTYDLSVPDGANFIAQDVFVHNSSLALNIARNAVCQQKCRVAIFSLEMSRGQLVQRLLSLEAAIDQHRLRMGWLRDEEWERLVGSTDVLSGGTLWIDDTARLSIAQLASRARRVQAKSGLDLIVVDYLQLLQATIEGKRQHVREQEIAEVSRGLKSIAKELNVPVLALAQLSRAVESRANKVPQLSDLRESGAIENDADVVLFIYRDEQQAQGASGLTGGQQQLVDLIIAKHRNGPIGYIRLAWNATLTSFSDLEGGDTAGSKIPA